MLELIANIIKKHETSDPFRICADLNITVIELSMSGIRGMYKHIKKIPFIFLDNSLSERDAEFVCAHELGHYFLHKGGNRVFLDRCTRFVTSKSENESDLFAACLLAPFPEDIILADDTVYTVASKIGVPDNIAAMYINEYRKQLDKNRSLKSKLPNYTVI